MQITYITTQQHVTPEQMEILLFGCHGGEIPKNFVVPTIDTTKDVSSYSVDLGDTQQPYYFYLDLSAISQSPHARGVAQFARVVLDAYIALAPRNGEFDYAGDMSRFILTQARAVSANNRFYRDHGIAIYQVVSELVQRMERKDLILVELTPEVICNQQIIEGSVERGHSPIVRIVAHSK